MYFLKTFEAKLKTISIESQAVNIRDGRIRNYNTTNYKFDTSQYPPTVSDRGLMETGHESLNSGYTVLDTTQIVWFVILLPLDLQNEAPRQQSWTSAAASLRGCRCENRA